MKAKIETNYEVKCPNLHGPNNRDQVTVINRREKMKDCKKCKWHVRFNNKELTITCDYKGKKE